MFVHISNEFFVPENFSQHFLAGTQAKHGPVSVHHWCDGRIERARHSQFSSQGANPLNVLGIMHHQNIRENDVQSLRFQKANRVQRALERARNQSDRIVNLRSM